jgi:hypothetical protein
MGPGLGIVRVAQQGLAQHGHGAGRSADPKEENLAERDVGLGVLRPQAHQVGVRRGGLGPLTQVAELPRQELNEQGATGGRRGDGQGLTAGLNARSAVEIEAGSKGRLGSHARNLACLAGSASDAHRK